MNDQGTEKPAHTAHPRSPHTPGDLAGSSDASLNETNQRTIQGWRVSIPAKSWPSCYLAEIG
jgi:hypothetical protein